MRLTKAIYLLQQFGTREIGPGINSKNERDREELRGRGRVWCRCEILANSSLTLSTILPAAPQLRGLAIICYLNETGAYRRASLCARTSSSSSSSPSPQTRLAVKQRGIVFRGRGKILIARRTVRGRNRELKRDV